MRRIDYVHNEAYKILTDPGSGKIMCIEAKI